MDERLSTALEFARYRHTLSNQIQKLKYKTKNMLTVSQNGGTFVIDRNLISFLDYSIRSGHNSVIILDINDIPVKIDNINDFLKTVTDIYSSVTEEYFNEYQSLRKSRNVKSIISLDNNE